MSASSMKSVKNRIKSIKGTMQITKAMGLVATSKMRKASERIAKSKPYFNVLKDAAYTIAKNNKDFTTPYTQEREGKTCHVIIGGDRGLAGGYNHNLFKSVEIGDNDIIFPIGKKVLEHFGKDRVYTDAYAKAEHFKISDCHDIGTMLCEGYERGDFTRIKLSYTSYINAITRQVVTDDVLPLRVDKSEEGKERSDYDLIIYEPSAEAAFTKIMPYYLSGMIYGAVSESVASELSARRNAMEAATDNAQAMIDKLSLEYNRARQSSITQELTEIVSGAENL